MITALEVRLRHELGVVRASIEAHEEMRRLIANKTVLDAELSTLVNLAPASTDWRIYDHSGTVTRLYAIYERFLEDLVAEWLSYFPILWPNYGDLPERVRRTHREGVGRILGRLHYRRYKKIDPLKLIEGLKTGLESGSYSLDPNAFIGGDRNYQPEVLRNLGGAVGLEDIWGWAERHRFLRRYFEKSTREDTTLESALKEFIEYRNDAAHGSIDQVLGVDSLRDLVSLIEALCGALAEAVRHRVIRGYTAGGHTTLVGKITEVFPRAGAVVAICRDTTLHVGDEVILNGEGTCRVAKVESIRIDDVDVPDFAVTVATEIGLALGRDVRENLEILLVKAPETSQSLSETTVVAAVAGSLDSSTNAEKPALVRTDEHGQED